MSRQIYARRALIFSAPAEVTKAVLAGCDEKRPKADSDCRIGTAVPLTADGYFLTAYHVISSRPENKLGLWTAGKPSRVPARLVWGSPDWDVALVKAEVRLPDYYRWTPRNMDLGEGTPVAHAGMATGYRGRIGHLAGRVPGHGRIFGPDKFIHTTPVEPGDSGGPIFVSSGELVGINSALETFGAMQTMFYMSSRGIRPDPKLIEMKIAADRRR